MPSSANRSSGLARRNARTSSAKACSATLNPNSMAGYAAASLAMTQASTRWPPALPTSLLRPTIPPYSDDDTTASLFDELPQMWLADEADRNEEDADEIPRIVPMHEFPVPARAHRNRWRTEQPAKERTMKFSRTTLDPRELGPA